MIKNALLLSLVVILSFGFTIESGNGTLVRPGAALSPKKNSLRVGDKAPDIMLTNPDGEEIALSSLVGKVVYLHFWASWCAPCRKENATVVQYYEKFKDKKFKKGDGFVVYSVSLDSNKDKWVEAIQKDNLYWKFNVSDLKGWDSEAAKAYGVSALPNNILIDADGTIAALETRGKWLEYEIEYLQ